VATELRGELREVRFTVHGAAVTKGSFRAVADKNSGRPILKPDQPGTAKWAARVAAVAETHAPDPPLRGPVCVILAFALAKPKSAPKTKRVWPIGRANDVDKLARAVLDAITGPIIVDDGAVCRLLIDKDYGEHPGVSITVREMEDGL
jgi:crossover junction endodeoxyribonuclease RusA